LGNGSFLNTAAKDQWRQLSPKNWPDPGKTAKQNNSESERSEMKRRKLTVKSIAKAKTFDELSPNSCNSLATTTTAEPGDDADAVATEASPAVREEYCKLLEELTTAVNPPDEAVARLKNAIVSMPGSKSIVEKLGASVDLKKQFPNGVARAMLQARLEFLKADLQYDTANVIERLIFDQILRTWVRLYYVQAVLDQGEGMSLEKASWWEQCLSSAQRRHFAAIETLARVRRLSRSAPLFQVNISQNQSVS
jgi:hypothetical protein